MMKNHNKILYVFSLIFVVVGCAKNEFSSTIEDVNQGILTKSERPYCEMDPTDYVLAPKIQSYSITAQNKASFGFNLVSGFLKALGLSFKIERGEVWVTTAVYSPVGYDTTQDPAQNSFLAMGDKVSTDTSKDIQVKIDLGLFQAGFEHYSKTPFFRISQVGLKNSLADAIEKLSKVQTAWSTKVVDIVNGMVVIPVGLVAGLQKQDEFEIYNVEYSWKGAPCGEYVMPIPTTDKPIATGKVIHLDTYGAALKITELDKNEKVDIGAMVRIKNLSNNDKNQRKLLRSVKVVDMESNPVPVEGQPQISVDFSLFANTQFRSMLNEYGFYMRPQSSPSQK